MSKETFNTFADAVAFYSGGEGDNGIRYTTVVEMNEEARTATLRTGEHEPASDVYVTIWPRKDSMTGEVEPVRVWGEEY